MTDVVDPKFVAKEKEVAPLANLETLLKMAEASLGSLEKVGNVPNDPAYAPGFKTAYAILRKAIKDTQEAITAIDTR